MTGTTLLPRSGDTDLWTIEEKAVAKFVGFSAEVSQKNEETDQWEKVTVVAPLGVRLAYLDHIERTGLNPVAKQLYLLLLGGKWTIMASIDGLRLIAERSKTYRGQTEPQWSDGKLHERAVIVDGKLVLNPDGTVYTESRLVWREGWAEKEPPALARVGVWKKGAKEPIWGVATWEAYAKTGKAAGQWLKNGPHMLAKCAESLALRKGFPQDLSGIYTEDEMGSETPAEDGIDYIAALKQTTTLEAAELVYTEAKENGAWSRHLDAEYRARRSAIRLKAEADAGQPPVVVIEGAS